MAFDMKIFQDLLGDEFTDEHKALLGNIGSPQAPTSNASAFGFEEGRNAGVKSLGDIMNDRNAAFEQSQARNLLNSQQKSQQFHQQELARQARAAQLQSAANQMQAAGNQRSQQQHAGLGMNEYYSALQKEKARQAAGPTRNPYADNFGLKEAFGALTNPTGFMAKTLMGAASGGAKKQPSAQQRQQMMQQMLRGSFGK